MGIEERRERERQARRTAVLQATRELVLERGFKGATTKRIAERCELSEATLFFYFQNKEEIYLSLLFEGIDFASRAIDRIVAMEAPAQDKLEAVWAFFSEVRAEHPEYFFVFSYLAHPRATSEVTETVRDEIARRSGDNFRRLAEVLSVAVGVENARLVGDLLWSAFAGLMVLRDTRTNLGAPSHPSETELAAAFRLLLSGIAPQRADGEKA
jgi:AcrR family transcriptional regulator